MTEFCKILKNKRWAFLLGLLPFVFSPAAEAQVSISATGNWSYSVPVSDILEAGKNFTGTYASASNQVLIDIAKPTFLGNLLNYNWRVDVRKSDVSWNAGLKLYAKRTGNGTPYFFTGTISGGASYIELTNTNQVFFSGSRTTYSIPIQFQITGVSLLLPAKAYSTLVVYTVTEL